MSDVDAICLLGFGEVGQVLLPSLQECDVAITAFDVKFSDPQSQPSRAGHGASSLQMASSVTNAVAEADLVVSAVTADQSRSAAASVTPALKAGAWYLDLNSVSPASRKATSELVEAAGGRYVEAAVMSPIQPAGIATPILLGGLWARSFESIARGLGFSQTSYFSEQLGKAAASKMCRSIMIKGMESLLTESLLAGRFYGVEDQVVDSLDNLLGGVNWRQHAAYMIGRSLTHGERRAAEMREVAATVQEAGLEPRMSLACAGTQEWAADFSEALSHTELTDLLDAILKKL